MVTPAAAFAAAQDAALAAQNALLPHFTARNNIIFDYGHSFVARGFNTLVPATGITDVNILQWACMMTKQRWTTDYAYASGVTGDTIAMALSRLSLAVNSDASTVLIQLGTNDCRSDPITLATMQSGYLQIINALVAAGKIVLMMPILPTYGYFTTAGTQKAEQFNRWMFQTLTRYPNVYAVDAMSYWTDLTRNDRQCPPGANGTVNALNYTVDNVHSTARGSFAAGMAIAAALNEISALYPKNARLWTPTLLADKVANPKSNLLAGTGRFLTGGGSGDASVTGTIASSWSMGTSGGVLGTFNMVASLVDKMLPNGQTYKMQQIALTNTGSLPVAAKFSNFTLTPSTYYTLGSASLRGAIDIEVDAGSSLCAFETQMQEFGASQNISYDKIIGDASATASILPAVAWSGRSRTPALPSLNVAQTALALYIRIMVAPNSTATVRLANPSIEIV